MRIYFLPKLLFVIPVFLFVSCINQMMQEEESVKNVMDTVIDSLYKTMNEQELDAIDHQQAMSFFSDDELEVLSTRHWSFDVNVPVVVSVMRSKEQKIVPFWLKSNDFKRTDLTMKNKQTTYEVWQKLFEAGTVGLGINGFRNYGYHYFVAVTPQNKNDQLKLSNFHPENQHVGVLDSGAFIYHDWTELVLNEVPESMKGQKLLTTTRGRGTESHLVGAFRETDYPSSAQPDQVMLTWSSDPSSSIDIQWRTDTTVNNGRVVYREQDSNREYSVEAEKSLMEDRELMNDRFIHRFTAKLRNLEPGVTYEYLISPEDDWTEACTFSTSDDSDSFSFIWFADAHRKPEFGQILHQAETTHPKADFYSIAGDLVSEGLHRDQWDELFEFSKGVISRKPLMAVPGNHDNHLGLGAKMYRQMFSYPTNGPTAVEKEQTYSFTYKNTLFLMLDATSPVERQTAWIEDQLATTDAIWKIAVFHFPPYNWEEPYTEIQKKWVPVFDKYHVDMVFSGHFGYYMRSKPLRSGQVVDTYNEGTAYIISSALPEKKDEEITDEPYAAVREFNGWLYQYIKIEDRNLSYKSVNHEKEVIDSFSIEK